MTMPMNERLEKGQSTIPYLWSRVLWRMKPARLINTVERKASPDSTVGRSLISMKSVFWRGFHSNEARRLRALKNKYSGHRCFILGTGPSLHVTDLSLLEREYTFAVNHFVPLGVSRFGLSPSFYCVSDREQIDHTVQSFSHRIPRGTLCFFPLLKKSTLSQHITTTRNNVYYINDYDGEHIEAGFFSTELDQLIYLGGSVIVDYCIPVAVYLGFTEIYLVGCDCTFDRGAHFFAPSQTHVSEDLRPDWQRAFLAFEVVKRHADQRGIRIRNATVGGQLEVFERVALAELF